MLQIRQLTVTKHINCEQQKRVFGGKSYSEGRQLWEGYASGAYDIKSVPDSESIFFVDNTDNNTIGYLLDDGRGHHI